MVSLMTMAFPIIVKVTTKVLSEAQYLRGTWFGVEITFGKHYFEIVR